LQVRAPIFYRAQKTQFFQAPVFVVGDDKDGDGRPHLFQVVEYAAIDGLFFKGPEEPFHHTISLWFRDEGENLGLSPKNGFAGENGWIDIESHDPCAGPTLWPPSSLLPFHVLLEHRLYYLTHFRVQGNWVQLIQLKKNGGFRLSVHIFHLLPVQGVVGQKSDHRKAVHDLLNKDHLQNSAQDQPRTKISLNGRETKIFGSLLVH
jgi:hypothetical protein